MILIEDSFLKNRIFFIKIEKVFKKLISPPLPFLWAFVSLLNIFPRIQLQLIVVSSNEQLPSLVLYLVPFSKLCASLNKFCF